MSLQPWIHPPIVLLAADHRTERKSRRSQVVERFGVPLNGIFEHLDTTIAEATPLYELCTSLLEPASGWNSSAFIEFESMTSTV
jgi:hypothetical protein